MDKQNRCHVCKIQISAQARACRAHFRDAAWTQKQREHAYHMWDEVRLRHLLNPPPSGAADGEGE